MVFYVFVCLFFGLVFFFFIFAFKELFLLLQNKAVGIRITGISRPIPASLSGFPATILQRSKADDCVQYLA